MKKAGITSYVGFAKEVLKDIKEFPVSLRCLLMTLKQWKKKQKK